MSATVGRSLLAIGGPFHASDANHARTEQDGPGYQANQE
jgi:hypothetical protein